MPKASSQRTSIFRVCRTVRQALFPALCLFTALAGMSVNEPLQARATLQRHDEFWSQHTGEDFAQWTFNGTILKNDQEQPAITLATSSHATCSAADIDGGKAHYDTTTGLCQGQDPYEARQYAGRNYYNGGTFYFGTLISPVHHTQQPIHTIIVSWDATTPAGTWLQIHIRAQENNSWTSWYKLPIWASDNQTIQRHSIDEQKDSGGQVDTDTFATTTATATAYQIGVTLFSTTPQISPIIRRITAIASNNGTVVPPLAPDRSVWGTNLAVPQRSQMLPAYKGQGYGGGGEVWCSPTSTSMVMAYWSTVLKRADLDQKVPDAARDTYDFTYEGTGNWPFNTAYASTYGLRAFVTRLYSLSQAEQWIKTGVPLVIALSYQKGELPGTPIESSNGHLLVIRGFTKDGDVIANDPAAASDEAVQIVYPRTAFEAVWLKYSRGTTYVIYPQNWPTPETRRLTNW